MKKNTFTKTCLSIAILSTVSSHSFAQDEPYSWNISGWINEGLTYYDDGVGSDVAQLSDNGTTLAAVLRFQEIINWRTRPDVGFEVIIEPFQAHRTTPVVAIKPRFCLPIRIT